jgi:uncharacterized membrane protein YfcA
MQVYLPIAELSVNVLLLLGLGGVVGFLSGMFGVGGGFLLTPLLILVGVPPAVAVGTSANQIVASSASGVLSHWRRGNVDLPMGLVLLAGGFLGSTLGVWLFTALRRIGQVDLMISLSYVLVLGTIGGTMVVESVRAMRREMQPGGPPLRKLHQHHWLHGLPLKMRFRRSKLYISALLPFGVGALIGVLAAIMGVGGGFIMVPLMIYLLGMPTTVVIGTSLFQIIFVAANVSFLQSWHNQTVDVIAALLLVVGGVVGAEAGTRAGALLRGEQLRGLMGLMVLIVALSLGAGLAIRPEDAYSLATRTSQ